MKTKVKPLLGGEGLLKLTKKRYGALPILQGSQGEAARLLNEHFRSGNPKHLVAFVVHIIGMRTHTGAHMQ
jgi:hypothetical protein